MTYFFLQLFGAPFHPVCNLACFHDLYISQSFSRHSAILALLNFIGQANSHSPPHKGNMAQIFTVMCWCPYTTISTTLVGCPDPFFLHFPNPTVEQCMSNFYVYGGPSEREYLTGILIKLAFELLMRHHFLRSIFYGFMSVFNSAFVCPVSDVATSPGHLLVPGAFGWQLLQSCWKMLGFAQTIQTIYI